MGLGTNRDYKTTDRYVCRNLRLLAELTRRFESEGLNPEDAEHKAFDLIVHPVKIFTARATVAISAGVKEREFIAANALCPELERAARKAYRAAKKEVTDAKPREI